MPSRKRISELAKERGITTQQLLAKCEQAGLVGKRAQSSLTDEEIALVFREGASPIAPVVVGQEKLVERMVTEVDQGGHTVTVREQTRETRIGQNTIRRRPSRETLPQEEVPQHDEFAGLPETEPVMLPEPLDAPLPLLFDLPFSEPSVDIPAPANEYAPVAQPEELAPPAVESEPALPLPPVKVALEPVPVAPPPHAVPPPVVIAQEQKLTPEPIAEPPRPSRVLGRIDLGKIAAEAKARVEMRPRVSGATPAARPEAPGALPSPGGDPAAAISDAQKRSKKRKVIHKPNVTETPERDVRLGRNTRKKRALPGKEQRQTEITVPRASKRVVRISEVVTVADLARNLQVKVGEVIKKLMGLGVMATINQVLDAETAALVAGDFDYTIENVAFDIDSVLETGHEVQEGEGHLESRPPVVTIMGHVDHGKTSLLDAIRQTNVTAREHGGITQHIGAYSVHVDGRSVTFLDTPGHEAFTAMRARGAKVTDIVTLVVAADDGVMPQTVEAINHARAAGVPVIVAVNKIDKPDADQERIKRQLMNHGLVPEDFGGETIFAPVSAKTGEGIPHLLEMILLQADVMDLRAHSDKLARGTIVEAKLDRGRGSVATVLIQEGVLNVGDPFVCGTQYGRVRAMIDSWGNKVEKASPSMPIEILGLAGVPQAGDPFVVLSDEAKARQVAEHRRTKQRETDLTRNSGRTTLEDFYQQVQAGAVKEIRVIIKADVQGSAEAVSDALMRLSTNEVKLTVLHGSVGGISESDVLLASASKGIIIGFGVRPESKAMQLAEREGVEIRLYTIIYEVIDDIRAALEGLLAPTFREKPLGRAEVKQIFTVSRIGSIAGCVVTDGRLVRGAHARLVRDRVVVHTGRLANLKRFKDDVREVVAGTECGASLENYQDVKVGDIIEVYELEQVLRRLESRPQQQVEQRA